MRRKRSRITLIERKFRRYLRDENSATFIHGVSQAYTETTLQRVAGGGTRTARRAAVLALGFVGGYGSNTVLGKSLRDPDRAVRILAENAIRAVWHRAGGEVMSRQLAIVGRLCSSGLFDEAIELATELIDMLPWFAEAWNRRGIAHYGCGDFAQSIEDCRQALDMNHYHFTAAAGMGHCYLELGDSHSALDCFRRALRLNPGMEDVREQVAHLRRILGQR